MHVAPINALRKKGLIVATVERMGTERAQEASHPRQPPLELNPDQVLHLLQFAMRCTRPSIARFSIHGVTGSGKTEVYIQAIEEVVRFGRQAILLVPEISLTPQTVARFRARFDRVAVLHSHMTDVERHEHWRRIARGEVEVVVGRAQRDLCSDAESWADRARRGARIDVQAGNGAAVSRPRRGDSPRGRPERAAGAGERDAVARKLAAGQAGESQLVQMPRRVLDRPMPAVQTIDLRNEVAQQELARRDQPAAAPGDGRGAARRRAGHSDAQSSRAFDAHSVSGVWSFGGQCPQCDLSLTFHRHDNTAVCHYCDFQSAAPNACPECDFNGIRFSGLGTQKLEAEVRARFPELSVRADGHRQHARPRQP